MTISFSQMARSPAVHVQLGNSSLTPHLTRGHLLRASSVLGVGVLTHSNILVGESENPKQVYKRTRLQRATCRERMQVSGQTWQVAGLGLPWGRCSERQRGKAPDAFMRRGPGESA